MALTPIDFPDDPQTGDSFTAGNGVTYTWYNNRWNGKVNDVILTVPPDEIELNMLQDVCDDVPTDGDVLTWNGTEWCGAEGPTVGMDGTTPVVTVGATNTLPPGQALQQTLHKLLLQMVLSLPSLSLRVRKVSLVQAFTFKGHY